MTDPEFIDPNELQPGPIQHASLSAELLEHIHAIYDVIGPYLNATLEQFEINFRRDTHPESEVAIWCSITSAWIAYHERHLGDDLLPDEEEKKLVAALVAISTGVEDADALGVTEDTGRRLMACYDSVGEE